MQTIKDRITLFLQYKEFGQAKFAEQAGLSKGFVNTTGDSISTRTINKIKVAFPELNTNWLISGEGEMLNTQPGSSSLSSVIETEEEYQEAINRGLKLLPEVDFIFAGSNVELLGSTDRIKRYWYLPDCKDCEAIAQVAGNSMAPAYPSGCWVALKKYSFDSRKPNQIPFGNAFGVVVEDAVTGDYHGYIKILRRHKDPEEAKQYWIARSVDTINHDDFDIDISRVRGLWIVKQHVVADVIL